MIINFDYLFKRFEIKNRFLYILVMAFNLSMGLVVTTLMPPLSANGEISTFATVVHWIVGFGNFIVNATVVLIVNLKIYKKTNSKKVKSLFAAGTSVCIADLLLFVVMTVLTKDPQKSKNGFYEIIPIFIVYLVLYILNHTDAALPRGQRDEAEKSLTARDERPFSSLCCGTLITAAVLFTNYAFVRNPIRYTISMTGIDYPAGFTIVCIALAVSFALNFIMLFQKYGYKNVFAYLLAIVGSASILVCAAVPTTMDKDIDILHALCALMFFFFVMAALMLFMLSRIKNSRRHRPFFAALSTILIAAVITLVIMFVVLDQRYGRTGLTELIPLEFIFIYFYLENHTDYFERESKEKLKKQSITNKR